MKINEELFDLLKNNKTEEFIKILESDDLIDINIRDENNNYLLTHAIFINNIKIIKLLIKKGARIDILDNDNRSILYLIINRGLDNLLEILLEANKEVIGIPIIDIKDFEDKIPLHYAIKQKNINAINMLLKYNSNVNAVDKEGFNALHMALYTRSIEICKIIINHNVNINSRTNTGETALHIACNLNMIEIIIILLKYNINIDLQDFEHGFTAFHYAVNVNSKDIVILLLKNGSNPNIQDAYGNTVIHYCIIEKNLELFEIINRNTKESLNYNLWNIEGKIPLHFLLENKPDRLENYLDIILKDSNLNIQEGKKGNSCLHYLCKLGLWEQYTDIIKKNKIDIFICNKEGIRPVDLIKKDKLDLFIDIITENYINRLRLEQKDWLNRWDNICKRELYHISDNDEKELKKENILIKNKKSKQDLCSDIIKKRLYNIINDTGEKRCSIPSFPLKKSTICVKLTEGTPLPFCTFTGSTMDVLFGLIYLLSKHKNTCSTLTKNFIENKNLCGFYKSIGIIMNNRCEFLNFEIVWVQYKLHLIENFSDNVKKCINNSDKRFIIFPVGIELREGSHANYLIYDKTLNEIERFEPHGATIPIGLNYNGELFDNLLESKFKNIIPDIIYIRPENYLPKIGFQLLDITDVKHKHIGDPGGFCALWVIWYTDMRLTYPDLPRNKLVNKLFISLRKNNISLKNMIRNYATNILTIRDNIFKKANIDINKWINDNYNDEQFDIIIKEIGNEINKIII